MNCVYATGGVRGGGGGVSQVPWGQTQIGEGSAAQAECGRQPNLAAALVRPWTEHGSCRSCACGSRGGGASCVLHLRRPQLLAGMEAHCGGAQPPTPFPAPACMLQKCHSLDRCASTAVCNICTVFQVISLWEEKWFESQYGDK